jgi:hypothetical protein
LIPVSVSGTFRESGNVYNTSEPWSAVIAKKYILLFEVEEKVPIDLVTFVTTHVIQSNITVIFDSDAPSVVKQVARDLFV